MANEQNLKGPLSPTEAREQGRKGGIASGKARREKKKLRELAQMILEEEIETVDGVKLTRGEAMLRVQARKAAQDGDLKALAFLRDTAGQAPTTQVEVSTSDSAKFNELLEQLEKE